MKRVMVILWLQTIPLLVLAQKPSKSQVAIGIKGGVNMSSVFYTDSHLAVLPQQMCLKPMGGLFLDLPISASISFAPELFYVERGMKTNYTHYSGNEVGYEINSRYMDLRFPFLFGLNVTPSFQPYLVAGAVWVICWEAKFIFSKRDCLAPTPLS